MAVDDNRYDIIDSRGRNWSIICYVGIIIVSLVILVVVNFV